MLGTLGGDEEMIVVERGDRIRRDPGIGERTRDGRDEPHRLEARLHFKRDHRERAAALEPRPFGTRAVDDCGRSLLFLERRERQDVVGEPFALWKVAEEVLSVTQSRLHRREEDLEVGLARRFAHSAPHSDRTRRCLAEPTNMLSMLLAAAFTLTSPEFTTGGTLPRAQANRIDDCGGSNVSPGLRWSGAPAATKSYALTVFDPDANPPRGWWHWIAFDIPANVHAFPTGSVPAGVRQASNSFGEVGYGGPCPPPGPPHHYVFTLYALDAAHVSGAPDAANFAKHALAHATLTGTYAR